MIYLASTSPRRKKILKQEGIAFRTVRPLYEEKTVARTPAATVRAHALGKAFSAAKEIADGIIVSADTIVWHGGKILGKPRDMAQAVKMLASLQGKTHAVYTGVAILKRQRGRTAAKHFLIEKTRVTLKPLTEPEIRAYFRKIDPLDKAGSYAIQSKHSVIARTQGLVSNATGLPIERILRFLK